ncbi:MAG: hypothetical protein ACFFFK_07545, partial [Candidatus Thorarchaeota archaeon]
HPVSYEILREGILVRSGPWNSSSETITINVDGLSLGKYNFTIFVLDINGNTANDTVFVNVSDGNAPTIDSPSDVTYDEGDTGYSISWNPSDLHPVSYEIFRDGVLIRSGPWNSSGESISISVDGLAPGEYNYTISVIDIGANSVVDQVNVVVQAVTTIPTPTTTSHPTQTTPTESPTPTPVPLDQLLIVVLTWIGTSIIILLVAEAIIRRSR